MALVRKIFCFLRSLGGCNSGYPPFVKMGAKESKQLRRDLESLKRNDPTLRTLDYEGVQLGNEGAIALARALRSNTNLRKLLLGHCNIGPDGLRSMVRCLCEDRLIPSRLRKLELVSYFVYKDG